MQIRLTRFLACALTCAALLSCTPQLERETPGIANRGILPLSTTDAYLGSNLFLAHEMENSAYLHNFIRTRGGPTAIEVEVTMSSPPTMLLYYPGDKQVYSAEKLRRRVSNSDQTVDDWVVRGPYGIEREDYRELAGMTLSMQGSPLLKIYNQEIRYEGSRKAVANHVVNSHTQTVAALPPTPPPTPTPTPVKKRATAAVITAESSKKALSPDDELAKNYAKLNLDQKALLIAKGYAERNDKGDVIHTVKSPGQTLEKVVQWYTGSTAAVDQIAKSAIIKDPKAELTLGIEITIPEALVTQPKQMK